MDVSKQNMEVQMLQKRLELLTRKEARIQELCKQHANDKKEGNYKTFYDEVQRVATSGGAFKQKVKMLTNLMKLGRSRATTKQPVPVPSKANAPDVKAPTPTSTKTKSKACTIQ